MFSIGTPVRLPGINCGGVVEVILIDEGQPVLLAVRLSWGGVTYVVSEDVEAI